MRARQCSVDIPLPLHTHWWRRVPHDTVGQQRGLPAPCARGGPCRRTRAAVVAGRGAWNIPQGEAQQGHCSVGRASFALDKRQHCEARHYGVEQHRTQRSGCRQGLQEHPHTLLARIYRLYAGSRRPLYSRRALLRRLGRQPHKHRGGGIQPQPRIVTLGTREFLYGCTGQPLGRDSERQR